MLGVIVNAVGIVVGSFIGFLLKKGIPQKISDAIMQALGLCVLYIGIDGLSSGENALVTVVSMVIGTAIGTLLEIEGAIERLSAKVDALQAGGGEKVPLSQGFLAGTLLFCVGSMAITGSIAAGLTGDNSILFAKSLLDFISAIMMTTTLGIGVALSGVSILLYQGLIASLAGFLQPVLEFSSGEIICTGSLILIAMGLKLVGILKIKVANLVPAVLLTPLFVWLFGFIM